MKRKRLEVADVSFFCSPLSIWSSESQERCGTLTLLTQDLRGTILIQWRPHSFTGATVSTGLTAPSTHLVASFNKNLRGSTHGLRTVPILNWDSVFVLHKNHPTLSITVTANTTEHAFHLRLPVPRNVLSGLGFRVLLPPILPMNECYYPSLNVPMECKPHNGRYLYLFYLLLHFLNLKQCFTTWQAHKSWNEWINDICGGKIKVQRGYKT